MNYYKVLNISTKADDKEIKKAYRLLAKKYHPDMYQGDKSYAEDKMQEINEAYDTLSNSNLRKEYDKSMGLYKEPEINNSSEYTSRKTTTSYSNTNSYHNVRYRPNNSNTYYDSYGYAETNYSAYTGDRYTRNKYEERVKLDRKDVAIKITVLLVIAGIILIALINMVINSFSEIIGAGSRVNNQVKTNIIRENGVKNINPSKNYFEESTNKNDLEENNLKENNIESSPTKENNVKANSSQKNTVESNPPQEKNNPNDIYNNIESEYWMKELEKLEIDEEAIKEKLNALIDAIEKYNEQVSN